MIHELSLCDLSLITKHVLLYSNLYPVIGVSYQLLNSVEYVGMYLSPTKSTRTLPIFGVFRWSSSFVVNLSFQFIFSHNFTK